MNIAVIIPCYNAAEWVGETVESVLNQTVSPAEIVVVNDGSTDDSRSILSKYEPRIRVVDQDNRGLSEARNVGARVSNADWLAFLDADDVYESEFIEEVGSLHAAFPDARMIFSDHSMFAADHTILTSSFSRYVPNLLAVAAKSSGKHLLCDRRLIRLFVERHGAFAPSALVVCRKMFEQIGGFCEGMRGVEDLDFYVHAAPLTPIGIVHKPLLRRRQVPNSLGKNYAVMRPATDTFFRRAESYCRREHPEMLDVVRRKYCGMLQGMGELETSMRLHSAARRTRTQVACLQPFNLRNWFALAASMLRSVVAKDAKNGNEPTQLPPVGS